MRWFTSDLHLGHVRIIDYTDRPYRHVAEMNEGLIALWNAVVDPDRRDHWVQRYLDVGGFVELHDGEVECTLADRTLRLCHFPYEGDHGDEDRYPEHRPIDDGRWLLHGHVHEEWRQRGRMINVGVDAWAGQPVSEEQLAELIDAGERNLDRRAWAHP